jgi:hypothetical protein
MTMIKLQLCLPAPHENLALPSEALAHVIIATYREPWTLNSMRREARRLHCERTHVKTHHQLLRYISEARLAAQDVPA